MKLKAIYKLLPGLLTVFSANLLAETWQLGIVAENSQSPFLNDVRETRAIPIINYQGERFSYINGSLRYQLSQTDTQEISLIAQTRSPQFYISGFDTNDDLMIEGLHDRKTAFELGLRLKSQNSWGSYELEGLSDISGTHGGFQLTASYSYPKQSGRWLVEPAIAIQLQSNELVDYYHGVDPDESQTGRPAYTPRQAINIQPSLMLGYAINPQLLSIFRLEQTELDPTISDSPIVAESRVRKIYLGLIYTF